MKNTYQIGMITTGYVTGIKSYGIFVKLNEEVSGLIHISEISDKYVSDISKFVTLGEMIRVEIIGIHDSLYQLSIKNIDYRIMKKRKNYIVETQSGFKHLARSLDFWLEEEKRKLESAKKR